MRISTMALVALVACGGGDKDPDGDSGTPTGATATTGNTTGTPGGSTTDPDRNATLEGVIFDCAGAPLEAAEIRFCDPTICRNFTTLADGAFTYSNTLVGWNSLEVFGPSGSDLATGFVPLELASAESRDVTMTLCPHDPWQTLSGSATELQLGTGLYITLSTANIEKPTPFDDEPTRAAGLMLDPAHHVPVDGAAGTVAAQWFTEPFNYKATDANGLVFRVDGATLGLAAATYRVWVGSYDDFAWLDAGTISDGDADGWYTQDGATGLPLLGTVVLIEE